MFGIGDVTVKAKILSDEGYHMADNSAKVALQHEKYIVEVHADGEEPFRTEVMAWVSWLNMPKVGDVLDARHHPGSHTVHLVIEGDPRYDWKMIAATAQNKQHSDRQRLLDGPASETF